MGLDAIIWLRDQEYFYIIGYDYKKTQLAWSELKKLTNHLNNIFPESLINNSTEQEKKVYEHISLLYQANRECFTRHYWYSAAIKTEKEMFKDKIIYDNLTERVLEFLLDQDIYYNSWNKISRMNFISYRFIKKWADKLSPKIIMKKHYDKIKHDNDLVSIFINKLNISKRIEVGFIEPEENLLELINGDLISKTARKQLSILVFNDKYKHIYTDAVRLALII